MSSTKNGITMSNNEVSFPWVKVFIALQFIALAMVLNPWADILSGAGMIIFCIELLVILFWAFPVFLYQLFVKGLSARDSLRHAVKSILDVLSYGPHI